MILVAGGTGTLGRQLVRRLSARGLPVRVLTRDPNRAARGCCPGVELVQGDVRDRAQVVRATHGVETVVSAVHGFAGGGGVSPAAVDRDGNANLIDAAAAGGASVVLMSVVGAAADSPMELFRMKHAAEEYVRLSLPPTSWTIVRATAFMETWLGLLEQAAGRTGRPLVFGRGENPINFVSVTDVAALLERLIVDPSTRGKLLEIGGPRDLTLNHFAALIQQTSGRTKQPQHVPDVMLRTMARLLRPVKPELARQARAALVMDTTDMTFDATPVRELYADLPMTTLTDVLAGWTPAPPARSGVLPLGQDAA
jgi:uncharacterized protein YbjT (DUF2867 family)